MAELQVIIEQERKQIVTSTRPSVLRAPNGGLTSPGLCKTQKWGASYFCKFIPIARTCYFQKLGVGIARFFVANFCLFLPIFTNNELAILNL